MKAVISSDAECVIEKSLVGYRIAGGFKLGAGVEGALGFQHDFVVQLLASSKLEKDDGPDDSVFPKVWGDGSLPPARTKVNLAINVDKGVNHTLNNITFLGVTEMVGFTKAPNPSRSAYWLLTFRYSDTTPAGNATVEAKNTAPEDMKHLVYVKWKGGFANQSKGLLALSTGVHGAWYFADLHSPRTKELDWMSELLKADVANRLDLDLNLGGHPMANLHLEVNGTTNTAKLILVEEVYGAFHALPSAQPEDAYRYFPQASGTQNPGMLDSHALEHWLFRRPPVRGQSAEALGGGNQVPVVERVSIWASASAAQRATVLL